MSMLKEIAEEEFEMEMTPMIDVTFLLLIFFLCTIKFKVLEGKLAAYLPKDVGVNSSQAEPIEKVEVTIQVDKAGTKVYADGAGKGTPWQGEGDRRFSFQGRELRYNLGPRKTTDLDTLVTWIEPLYKKEDNTPATIDCRPGTVYGDMVPVLDAFVEAKFEKITFVGEYKQTKK